MRYAIALLLSATIITQAQAQDASAVQVARKATVEKALAGVKSDPAGTIALLDPVLGGYDRDFPASGPHVFCANDMTGTLTGLVVGAAVKKDAVALDNVWCYALWAKGFALIELGRIEDAVAPLTRAAQMMPGNTQFQIELGYVHQTLKHWGASMAAYNAAANAAQKMPAGPERNLALRRAWFGIGFNEIELRQYDAAEKHMKQALEVAPGDEKILNELEYIRTERAKKTGKAS